MSLVVSETPAANVTAPTLVSASAESLATGSLAVASTSGSAISPSSASNKSAAASAVPETGSCHGPPGLKDNSFFSTGIWKGEVAADEVTCNAALNNVTRLCCDEVKGEGKMGAECDIFVCKVKNTTEAQIKECFGDVKNECRAPTVRHAEAPQPSHKSAATRRATAALALALLAGSVLALGTAL